MTHSTPWRAIAIGIAVLGAVAALANLATAQTPDPSTSPAPATAEEEVVIGSGAGPGRMGMKAHRGFGGPGIHGESVVPDGDGGWRTIATQVGEVVEATRSSITLKSEDGYTRTYTVDENTLVHATRDGIAGVKPGDTAHVTAVVDGDTARAVDIGDMTVMRRSHEQWMPRTRSLRPTPTPGD